MIHISSVEGNRQWLDGGAMFGNAPRALWERWAQPDSMGRIPLACRCLLIEADDLKILCETGIGGFFEPKLAERFGVESPAEHRLRDNLAKLGIEEADIDYVILSHLHFDHAGGLLPTFQEMENGNHDLLFPNAKYVVGEEAWDRAQNPHFRDRASFVPLLNKKLDESGRLVVVKNNEPPKELSSFIEFFTSHGHTPGQMHTLLKGQGTTMVFAGDLIPGSSWVHLPITMGYDRFPEKLIDEKRELYNRFENQDLKIFFTHDAKYATGQLAKNEKGKFEALHLQESLQKSPLVAGS